MKINWYLIIIALLIGLNIFQCSYDKPDNRVEEVKKEANAKIDGYLQKNDSLEKAKEARKKVKDSLQQIVETKRNESKKVNDDKDKTLSNVDGFAFSELQQYFTDNYPE